MTPRRCRAIACAVVLIVGATSPPAGAENVDLAAEVFFEERIRPLLSAACWDCHSEYGAEADLELDSLAGMLRGGLRGPAIVPGDAEASLLIRAINHGESLRMPEEEKLPLEEIQALTQWVDDGAVWPDAEPFVPEQPKTDDGPLFTEEERRFWAFQPPRLAVAPQAADADWARTEVDRFVAAALEERGLHPAPAAPRHVLLRRASFDLTGLPPTPEDVESFEADVAPDAFRRRVDRLLASPRYGERWGRHWLDVARYADSNGLDENIAFENIYKYRDWVIRAFNADMPYTQFVTEQLAGDLIPQAPDETAEDYIERVKAAGFLSVGPKMVADDDPMKKRMDVIDEQLNTVGSAFLAMTIGCARCHDHKFDPIPTQDYYSLAGIFGSTRTLENLKVVAPIAQWELKPTGFDEQAAAHQARLDAVRNQADELFTDGTADFWTTHASRTSEYLLEAIRFGALGPAIDDERDYVVQASMRGVEDEAETVIADAFRFQVVEAGRFRLFVRYAHPKGQEFAISVDGERLEAKLGAEPTGGRAEKHQRWFAGPAIELTAGEHVVSLDPLAVVVDRVALVRESAGDLVPRGAGTPTVAAAAETTGLHQTLLSQWAAYLRQHQSDDSKFWSGLRTAALAARTHGDGQRLLSTISSSAAKWLERPETEQTAGFAGPLFADDGPFRRFEGVEALLPEQDGRRWKQLQEQVAALEAAAPRLEKVMAVRDDEPVDFPVMIRGDYITPGEPAPRRFLRIVDGEEASPLDTDGSGRLELAQWIARGDNPLTARVIVNRVWRWRFGTGLVPTVDNFGRLGERPTHPELLDALAVRFSTDDAWSLKRLHLRLTASATYQMDSTYNETAAAEDPTNSLLWRYPRRRLEAESIRDATLAVSGALDQSMFGSLHTLKDGAYVTGTASKTHNYTKPRRSIYLPIFRSAVYDMLTIFDFPDPAVSVGDRATSIVAPQSLFLLNSPFVDEAAGRLADEALANYSNDADRVSFLYRRLLARAPSADERRSAQSFLSQLTSDYADLGGEAPVHAAWQGLCRGLLASSEFTYID